MTVAAQRNHVPYSKMPFLCIGNYVVKLYIWMSAFSASKTGLLPKLSLNSCRRRFSSVAQHPLPLHTVRLFRSTKQEHIQLRGWLFHKPIAWLCPTPDDTGDAVGCKFDNCGPINDRIPQSCHAQIRSLPCRDRRNCCFVRIVEIGRPAPRPAGLFSPEVCAS